MASYLLFLVAVLEVINAILVFATLNTITDTLKDVYADTSLGADGAGNFVGVVYGIGAGFNLLLAAGFAVLGIFNGRGKNPSRIITWVVGGIALCCVGAGLGGNALTGSLEDSSTSGAPTQSEIQARLNDALPSWYQPVTMTVTVIILIAILATIILLALPASNEFFRKRPVAQGWEQAVPYPTYPPPGQPGYPAQPYGQPGQPAPGLPPYAGQQPPPPSGLPSYPGQQAPPPPGSTPPGSAPPPSATPPGSDPYAPPPSDQQPPRPPTDPA
ncbi:hypothetical protein ACIA5D_25030 [Actinoplanes sp. NPDC051513]|uniref:hypothetical protein n=1 Tax=Actinoplanes sp. NPDC051513 TaxID=3363908 RepID=UPI003793CFC8